MVAALIGAGTFFWYKRREINKILGREQSPNDLSGLPESLWQFLTKTHKASKMKLGWDRKSQGKREKFRVKLLSRINQQISENLFGENNPFQIDKDSLSNTQPLAGDDGDKQGITDAREIIKKRYQQVQESEGGALSTKLDKIKKAYKEGIEKINQTIGTRPISDPRVIAKKLQTLRYNTIQNIKQEHDAQLTKQIANSNILFQAAIEILSEEDSPDKPLTAKLEKPLTAKLEKDNPTLKGEAQTLLDALKNSGKLDIIQEQDVVRPVTLDDQLNNLESIKLSESERLKSESKKRKQNLDADLANLTQDYMLQMNRRLSAAGFLNRLTHKEQHKYAKNIFTSSAQGAGAAHVLKDIDKSIIDIRNELKGIDSNGTHIKYDSGVYSFSIRGLGIKGLKHSLKDQAAMVALEHTSIKFTAKAVKYNKNGQKGVDHEAVAKLAGEQVLATILQLGLDPSKSTVRPQTGLDKDGNATFGHDDPIKIDDFLGGELYKKMSKRDKKSFDKNYDAAIKIRTSMGDMDPFKYKPKTTNAVKQPSASNEASAGDARDANTAAAPASANIQANPVRPETTETRQYRKAKRKYREAKLTKRDVLEGALTAGAKVIQGMTY